MPSACLRCVVALPVQLSSCSRTKSTSSIQCLSLFRAAAARRFSSARDVESHTVTCGSSGSITVDLYNRNFFPPTRPYIIYLPPHPTYSATSPFPEFFNSHPIARINYRWNHQPSSHFSSSPLYRNHAFPTPLHDVLHGYTWLSAYLSNPEFYIYGSHLGGTLATSLALTESRATRIKDTPKIRGLIAKDAIFDWTGIATSKNPLQIENTVPPKPNSGFDDGFWTTQTLHDVKTSLFSQPSQCFDSFASPILFFRTADVSIPEYFPGLEPPISTKSEVSLDDIYLDEEGNVVEKTKPPPTDPSPSPISSSSLLSPETLRKSHLTFPPRKSGLRIPRSLILSTLSPLSSSSSFSEKENEEKGELENQAEEFCRLMQRSIMMHESKDRRVWDDSFDAITESDSRVRLRTLVDVEDEMERGKEERRLVGEWLDDDGDDL